MKHPAKIYVLQWLLIGSFFFIFPQQTASKTRAQEFIYSLKLSNSVEESNVIQQNILQYIYHLDFNTATAELEKMYTIADSLNFYEGKAFTKYFLAYFFIDAGKITEGYQAANKSAEEYRKAKNVNGEACAISLLGDLHSRVKSFSTAVNYFEESADLFHKHGFLEQEVDVRQNIGTISCDLNLFEKAFYNLKAAITIYHELNDTSGLSACYFNLASVFQKTNQPDSAFVFFQKSLEFARFSENSEDSVYSLFGLGNHYFLQNKPDSAQTYFSRALQLLENKQLPFDEYLENVKILESFYLTTGNMQKAIEFKTIADSLELKNDQTKALTELNQLKLLALEEINQKEKEKTKKTILVFSAVLFILVLFLFTLYRNYKIKQRANQLLTEMDELKNRMFSDITHEFRTPLTLILGPLEQMLSSEAKRKPTHQQINLMRKNANSLLNLVNQMLDLSKIDAKGLILELVENDIIKFVRVHFVAFNSLAEQKNIQFNCYIPADEKIRFFDAGKLEKIINNLISNAIKYTPKNGQIFCFASFPSNNFLEIIIPDPGKGIPETEVSKIFQRFHHIPNHEVSTNLSTGIGLSLTKELVELLHGTIEVESVLGEGTKFNVKIPLGKSHLNKDEYIVLENNNLPEIKKESFVEEENQSTGKKAHSPETPKILIVEDHVEIREFLPENLQNIYFTETAKNGVLGFEKAVEIIPDLIVSDFMMPGMNGIDMCKKLKNDERTSHIPVIILTARTKDDDKYLSLESGADEFLPKPINLKELKIRIKNLIQQRENLRLRFTRNLKLEPKDIAITSADEKFLDKIMEILEENMGNSEFEVQQLQEKMFMSRMQLYRKIKALSNQNPSEFIRTIRLKRAASLLENKFGNIAQVAFEVGFSNPSYFSKCFKELYGKLPSEFIQQQN